MNVNLIKRTHANRLDLAGVLRSLGIKCWTGRIVGVNISTTPEGEFNKVCLLVESDIDPDAEEPDAVEPAAGKWGINYGFDRTDLDTLIELKGLSGGKVVRIDPIIDPDGALAGMNVLVGTDGPSNGPSVVLF